MELPVMIILICIVGIIAMVVSRAGGSGPPAVSRFDRGSAAKK
jgi:hypothetical protein